MGVPRENIPKGELEFEARKGLSPFWDMYKDGPVPEELSIEEIHWIEDSMRSCCAVDEGVWV